MRRTAQIILALGAISAVGGLSYAIGHLRGDSAAMLHGSAAPPSSGPILFYRDPTGRPLYSATPRTTDTGEAYLPVRAGEEAGVMPVASSAAATDKGGKRIKLYRNPMGLPDVSATPKKDSMGMDYIPVYEGGDDEATSVQVSVGKVQRSGVRTEVVGKRSVGHLIRAPGVVELDERRISVVSLRFDAFITQVGNVTTGVHVKKGEPLMTVYGQVLLSAGAQLVIEEETGWKPTAPATRRLGSARDPRAPVIGARRRLQNLDVPQDVIDQIQQTRRVPQTIVWPSPRDGIVLERSAVEGMRAKTGDVLFRIADHSVVWVMADIPERDIGAIKPGQSATVRARAHPGREFTGQVALLYPHLNKETRTARVRIELPNPNLVLLPDMYTDVEISAADAGTVIAVPDSAVVDTGTRQVVIVDKGEGRFEPRDVKLGQRGDGYVEIRDGIQEGEKVVTTATFLIDAESNLKAALKGLTPAKEVTP